MKKMTGKDNNKGFTLAELLVVVAIIAILVAVSIVIFTGKQKEAKATVCEANRTSLKHHLAVDYMGGDLETLTDEVFDQYIKVDEAVCPSKGTYSFTGSFENGFQIKCSYHDGDGSSGGGTEAKSAVDNLIDAVKEIIGITGQSRNSEIVKAFFGLNFGKENDQNLGDGYLKFAKDVNMADIFNGVDLNELAEKIKTKNGKGDVDSLVKSLKEYESKSYKVVPYYAANGKKVVPYFVNGDGYNSLKKGKDHVQTSVCYVEGHWYFNKETNHNATSVNSGFKMPSVDKAYNNAKKDGINIEKAMNDNGWIKVK